VTPQRIQLRRTKGWRKPAHTKVVSRPAKWGNPWKVVRSGGTWDVVGPGPDLVRVRREDAILDAVALYRDWITGHGVHHSIGELRAACVSNDLRGFDLACWCPLDQPCHADVLLELANR
jgi:hypothetical protein